ncbi:unnamed protein product [Cylindrotheca closterium]|uniref:Uncharacterized protein n=1 Tax=Cylindrotheca closterium TaxID=2856 RepID=A0AAD2FRR0_9STRA|nr:unnamed protein product [Cylindrotheca closterium]
MVAEAARMAAQERVKLKAERRRKEIEVEARRKLATETRKKFETETQRRLEEIEIRRKFEVEAQRKLEYEQQRQHEREQLRRKQEKELAEERNRVEAEMEKMKAEAEARRLAVVAQALELQKVKEAEEQRKKDLKDLILFSTKTLLLRRWVRRLSRNLELIRNSRDDLQNIDPTFFKSTLYLDPLMANPADEERSSIAEQSLPAAGTRSVLETLLRLGVEKRIDLSHLVLEELATFQNVESQRNALQNRASKTRTILLKLGVVVQSHEGADRVSELVRLWISSALETGEVHVTEETSFTVRSLAVLCRNERDISDCDVVLCLHPGGGRSSSVIPAAKSVVLLLDAKYSNRRDLDERGSTAIHPKAVSTEAFESALSSACKVLTRMFLRDFSFSVERKHFFSIASQAIIKSLWMPFSSGTKNEDDIMGRSRIALLALSEEVSFKLKKNRTDLRSWPPNEFSSSTGMVDDYFSQRQGLPVNWIESVDKKGFDSEVSHLLHVFNSPLREVVTDLLGRDAPRRLKDACASMLSRRQFRGCLEKALGWRMGQIEVSSNRYIYFPSGVADSLISGVGRRLSQLLSSKSQGSPSYHIPSRFKLNISTTVDFFETGTVNQSVAANGEIQSISDDLRPLSNAKSSHTVTELVNRKKSGSRELQQHDASFSKRKKRRMEPSHRVMESSSFSKRLESFLDGETLDVQIGDKTLDSILAQRGGSLQEDVAIIKTRKQRKYGRQISNCQI